TTLLDVANPERTVVDGHLVALHRRDHGRKPLLDRELHLVAERARVDAAQGVPVDTDALGQLLDRAGEVAVLVVLRHAHLPALPYFGQAGVRRSAAGRVAFPSAVRSPGSRRLNSWCMTSASGPGIASVRARLMYERPIRGSASAIASLSLWTSLALRIGVG